MIQTDEKVLVEQPSTKSTEYSDNKTTFDYSSIVKSEHFIKMCKEKTVFTVSYTIFFMLYALLLPYLALTTNFLNAKVIGEISWAWIYGISMIPMSFIVCSIYLKKADYFDKEAKNILENQEV
ncbi:DUF485 domain-containing protein [Rummeliibacillus sp. NPDC094406]|uniref:DUF485 domain-containing protein n=1 Tax=Rummeliibacillus sp. NPDC094406 TaxID=3364511 RepID=UPI0037F8096A